MAKLREVPTGDGFEHIHLKPQRMKVAARGLGLRRHLFSQLGQVFHIFVQAFKLQVGPTDQYGLGPVIMGQDERATHIKRIVTAAGEDPGVRANILGAFKIMKNLEVSPKSEHILLAVEFHRAVVDVCTRLCLDQIAKRLDQCRDQHT